MCRYSGWLCAISCCIGNGNIINIASIGGLKGGVAGAAYTTSKHALIGLTKNTGHVYAKTGIRCNAIAPGAVATSIGETIDITKITPMVQDRIMTGMALNPRIGEPNEIAAAALFLASDDASFINGAVLVVDGGWLSGRLEPGLPGSSATTEGFGYNA